MTTTDERTPLDPTISEIHRLIESIGGRLNAIAAALDALSACPMHEPGDPDCRPSHGGACRPPVDMLAAPDDPLREFRLPSGRVAYETTYADEVKAGDWVQRCHGDPEWHQVTDRTLAHNTGGDMVRIGYADDNFYWWAPTDAIRVARLAADVVAAQDKTA